MAKTADGHDSVFITAEEAMGLATRETHVYCVILTHALSAIPKDSTVQLTYAPLLGVVKRNQGALDCRDILRDKVLPPRTLSSYDTYHSEPRV